MASRTLSRVVRVAVLGLVVAGTSPPALAALPANDAFQRTWARTDKPVADVTISRTWMWGPDAFTPAGKEFYVEAPGQWRTVQYFDKSRMEITDPAADQSSPWFVTNGLLVVELMSGLRQVGNDEFQADPRGPVEINVAGDRDDPDGPTYRTFDSVRNRPGREIGTVIAERLRRDGVVAYDSWLEGYGATTSAYDPVTDHSIAAPFWAFMNSTGTVWEGGSLVTDTLFENPFYATGRPVTEAYWARVRVAGTAKEVLTQCFERRCLTYTPENPEGWQVEAGNVGRHYYEWMYGPAEETPPHIGLKLYDSSYENWTEWPIGDFNANDVRWLGNPIGSAQRFETSYIVTILAHTAGWTATGGNLPQYGDVSVATDVRLVNANPTDRACLLTHLSVVGTTAELYAFCLVGDGGLIAFHYRYAAGAETSDWLLPPGMVHSTIPVTDFSRLEIRTRGNELWFVANDILYLSTRHDGPVQGYIAVGAQRFTAFDVPVSAQFKGLVVRVAN